MLIVASDLSENQRERLTSTLSLRRMSVSASTLDMVQKVFTDLFCMSKSSIRKPSMRASAHGGSTSRTFIVEDYSEDENGQWRNR